MVRNIAGGLVGALMVALAVNCGGGDDDGPFAAGGTAGTGNSGTAGAGDGGEATEGGADGEGGAGGSGQIPIGNCETIEGLNVTSECAASAVEGRIKTVNMLLVMDKSTSMNQPFNSEGAGGAGGTGASDTGGAGGAEAGGGGGIDAGGVEAGSGGGAEAGGAAPVGPTGPSRWDVLKVALNDAMTETQASIEYGLLLYPSRDDCSAADGVQVSVGEGGETVPDIVDALDANPPDVAGTPMAAALDAALEYYTNGDGADLVGDKYVLLATDGGPNCNDSLTCEADQCSLNLEGTCPIAPDNCCAFDGTEVSCVDHGEVTAKIEELHDAGIDTFVVGIPGSEAYADFLADFADAGGQAPDGPEGYYRVEGSEGAAGLTETFTEIARVLVTDCEIPIEVNVPSPTEVNVAVDCTVVPGSSWEFNDDFTQITITGDECTAIQETGVERIDVIFGCPIVQ